MSSHDYDNASDYSVSKCFYLLITSFLIDFSAYVLWVKIVGLMCVVYCCKWVTDLM